MPENGLCKFHRGHTGTAEGRGHQGSTPLHPGQRHRAAGLLQPVQGHGHPGSIGCLPGTWPKCLRRAPERHPRTEGLRHRRDWQPMCQIKPIPNLKFCHYVPNHKYIHKSFLHNFLSNIDNIPNFILYFPFTFFNNLTLLILPFFMLILPKTYSEYFFCYL